MKSHPEAAERGDQNDSAERVIVSPEQQHGEHANAISAMSRRMVIPGDVVNKATQDLPDDQRSAVRGMHAYAVMHNLSNDEVGAKLKNKKGEPYSGAAISLVFRGKYEASLANITRDMTAFLELENSRAGARPLSFIITNLYTKHILPMCETTLRLKKIGFLFGDYQIGKSESLQHYQRTHNHGSTIYLETPAGGALCYFLAELAAALRIQTQSREVDLRRRILEAFDDRMLLIVDEADRAVPGPNKPKTVEKTFDFLCELNNKRKCGVVICGNNTLSKGLLDGSSDIMKKLWRRQSYGKQLPDHPTRADLNTFAKAWGLPPSAGATRELESKLVENDKLGVWLNLLVLAAELANKREERMSWQHVHLANGARDLQMAKPGDDTEE